MRKLRIKSLPRRTWIDKDEIMLHACFQLLTDYIEEEKGDIHCNYESHKEFVDEIRFLYKWWKDRKSRDDIEEEEKKNDEMLFRLIKVRRSLWT